MAKCLVIGGGLAGISAGVHLSQAGHRVRLIEASPKLGGRTYSFIDKKTNSEIDNGQHILMGAYKATFELLQILGSDKYPQYQSNLEVKFLNKNRETYLLKAPNGIYPFNLIKALFKYDAIGLKEKLSALRLLGKIYFNNVEKLKNKSLKAWLKEEGQTDNSISALWEVIAVGALNTKLDEASAVDFFVLLSGMFFNGNKSSTVVLPNVPLNKLFVNPAQKYFDEHNVSYSCSEKLVSIEFSGKNANRIITDKREYKNFDKIILAIPPYAIDQIKSNLPILPNEIMNMETSPIISIHLWSKEIFLQEKFIGIIGSKIHWVFNNKDHISIVISAADELTSKDSNEIFDIVCKELLLYFTGFKVENILHYIVIKEKRATLKCNINNSKLRKSISTNFSNVCFAGDWTNTGLPGTIEGAILSGKICLKNLKNK